MVVKMVIGKYRIGLRTLKTAIAVMCCIIFFHITHRGSPMVATLAAVFALREDMSTTMSFGKSRILGNTIGGISGILYYLCLLKLPNQSIGEIFLVPFFVLVTITISIRLKNEKGIIGGVATLLFLCFSIPKTSSFTYAIDRVIDTFIGTLFAILWNYLIKSPLEDKEETLEEKKEQLAIKKREVASLEEEIDSMEKNIPADTPLD
ncbi:FUSC family protein [Vagococcus martis]|nr:aromatic acid exporter family protein [Vagococcus martis]